MISLIAAFLTGCPEQEAAPPELRFVRDGVLVRGTEEWGKAYPGGWTFVRRAWVPGDSVTIGKATEIAPKIAECVPLAEVPLGDVSRLVAAGGAAPDTDVTFSPDGQRLAVGTYRGDVLVIDVQTGTVIARRSLGEGMVREVRWSPDSHTIYAGEQSPDAMLRALDATTLADRWTSRLADIVGSSSIPAGDDLYAMYTLPGVYGLEVLADGTILVAVSHGFPTEGGLRRNQSALIAFGSDGSVARRWPENGALDAVLVHPVVSRDGSIIAVPVTRSADGLNPADLPVGGMALLNAKTFERTADLLVEPLKPWFTSAYLWNAADVDPGRDTVMLGFGDGRVVLSGMGGASRTVLTPGTPVTAGEVPIAASVGHGFLREDTAIFLTSGTNIPWGAAAPELRPPSPHPGENTVWAVGLDGSPKWSFHGPWSVQGLTLGDDRQTLVVGAGERLSDNRRDLYGALLFNLDGADRSGEDRLLSVCSTTGPVFFRQAMSRDGVVALAEVPFVADNGNIAGEYRVVLFR